MIQATRGPKVWKKQGFNVARTKNLHIFCTVDCVHTKALFILLEARLAQYPRFRPVPLHPVRSPAGSCSRFPRHEVNATKRPSLDSLMDLVLTTM